MFKFSYNWLKEESEIGIDSDSLLSSLRLQGFEIASVEETTTNGEADKIIEIEVKANRPDMLSVAGVLREHYAEQSAKEPKEYSSALDIEFSPECKLSREIIIKSADVHEYNAIEIENVDNTGETPAYIASRLKAMGIDCINPLVDISNYILLWLGQPIHIFDRDKVQGAITVANNKKPRKFQTLGGKEITLPKNALMIDDEEKGLCLAGIIGGLDVAVTKDTKNIIIESANFDHIIIRVISKELHISTASSYRFERGVARSSAELGGKKCAEMVLSLCGGNLNKNGFKHTSKHKAQRIRLTAARTNEVLGTNLSIGEIAALLEKCFIKTEITGKALIATVPDFRLDIEIDVDLIEEVGRMYGYHNIEPQPITLSVPYEPNEINVNSTKIREILVGHGLIECLNYGFIPSNAMDILGLKEGDKYHDSIVLHNPLSSAFANMRPTLCYSLISTAVNNLKKGITNVRIFEIGRRFLKRGEEYEEKNTVAALLYGAKHGKGFGQSKEVKLSVFDIADLAKSVLQGFGLDYHFENSANIKFLEKGAAAEIFVGDRWIGCVGMVSKNVLKHFESNVIKDDMYYFEFDFNGFKETQGFIKHESNYPAIRREYNFLVKSGTHFADYNKVIYGASPLVIDVRAVDVYMGQGVPKGMASVLVSVSYNSPKRTLESAEIDHIESDFKAKLNADFGITLKM